jgi:hypothetical protein
VFIALTLSLLLAGAIYVSCEYFVNGVEWVGRQLKLSATTTGTVLAAFALWLNRRRLGRQEAVVEVDHRRLSRDQGWFLAIFVVKVALGLVAFAFKPALGLLFLAAYAVYVFKEMRNVGPPALLLSPVATELPETMAFDNSLLAAGVVTGVAVIVLWHSSIVVRSRVPRRFGRAAICRICVHSHRGDARHVSEAIVYVFCGPFWITGQH